MALNKTILAAGLAAFALLGTSIAASAAPAVATGNVNVRSGPSTSYHRVDVLRRGERVDVQSCRGNWCFVEKRGPDGWVSANYLERTRHHRPSRRDWDNDWRWDNGPDWGHHRRDWDRRHYDWRHNNSRGSVCFSGPNSSFCIGN